MSLALALLAVGCNDDEIAPDRHPANTGDEVQFGVALPGADTRTIYGEETETGFPVYWVNEDKVKVASPQCNIKEAEYQVTVNSAAQNYADNLTKTGDAGIQWGESETADFYSIYPSEGATFKFAGNTVTAELSVDATQYASITDKGTSYYAQPADMNNVVMYAKNAGVSKTSETVACNTRRSPRSSSLRLTHRLQQLPESMMVLSFRLLRSRLRRIQALPGTLRSISRQPKGMLLPFLPLREATMPSRCTSWRTTSTRQRLAHRNKR